jgi:DNA-binding transcriptional ArsR family regulator
MIPSGRDQTSAVALFRSLGDPARLAIVRRLAEVRPAWST